MIRWLFALALVTGCSKHAEEDKPRESLQEMKDDASVGWAREQLPALDAKLASADPGAASSICAVIKPDLAKIHKADAALGATLDRRCGRDLAVRSYAVAVERAEKDHAQCRLGVYEKMIAKANADADPEVTALRARVAAACPKP